MPQPAATFWSPRPLVETVVPLDGGAGSLVRVPMDNGEAWALVAAAGAVRVNGAPLALGLRVLRDKDEICSEGGRVFFSEERLAAVEPFAGAAPVACARCRQPVEPGSPSVRCAGCGVVCHESPELPCMTYTPTCPLCSRSSTLGAFTWTPEDLET
jgi:hypothetical protein